MKSFICRVLCILSVCSAVSALWGCEEEPRRPCETDGSCDSVCGNGKLEVGEVCDGELLNDATCASQKGEKYEGKLSCKDDCSGYDTTSCTEIVAPSCGNESLDEGEVCDGVLLNDATCESEKGEEFEGILKCSEDCTSYDTSDCTKRFKAVCSNDQLEEGEICDGELFGGATCASEKGEGFYGKLSCSIDCQTIDSSDCHELGLTCGNKTLDLYELCDGELLNGKTCETVVGKGYVGLLKCKDSCAEFDFSECVPKDQTRPLRVLTANLNGNQIASESGDGGHIFKALNADIVLVQDFGAGEDTKAFVHKVFGEEYYYCIGEPLRNNTKPNGIISRFPMKTDEENKCYKWDAFNELAHWSWALVTIPGEKTVLVASINLTGIDSSKGLLTLKAKLLEQLNSHKYFGSIVGGQFNTQDRIAVEKNFSEMFVLNGSYPADHTGNENTDKDRTRPANWILSSSALPESTMTIGTSDYPHGIVFDSRVYSPLSDVEPVTELDSVSGMKDMVVGREFRYMCKGCED